MKMVFCILDKNMINYHRHKGDVQFINLLCLKTLDMIYNVNVCLLIMNRSLNSWTLHKIRKIKPNPPPVLRLKLERLSLTQILIDDMETVG